MFEPCVFSLKSNNIGTIVKHSSFNFVMIDCEFNKFSNFYVKLILKGLKNGEIPLPAYLRPWLLRFYH